MPEPLIYLKAMGAATAVSAIFVLTMLKVRPTESTTWLNSACAAGIGCGIAVGCYVLSLRLTWPPVNGLDRFLTIVVPLALGIELIAGFERVARWVAWLLRISLIAVIPRVILHGSVYLNPSNGNGPLWQTVTALSMCVALAAGLWGLLSWLSRRSPGVSIPLALCLTFPCAGMTVMMAGYINGGAAAFPLVASLLGATIAAMWITKRFGETANFSVPVILGIGVIGLFGLLFIGRFFGRLSTGGSLIMLLAPLLCWATEIPLLRHRKPWQVGSIRLMLVAIPLVVVLVLAKRDFDRDMAPLLGKLQESTSRSHCERCVELAMPLTSLPFRTSDTDGAERGRNIRFAAGCAVAEKRSLSRTEPETTSKRREIVSFFQAECLVE